MTIANKIREYKDHCLKLSKEHYREHEKWTDLDREVAQRHFGEYSAYRAIAFSLEGLLDEIRTAEAESD